MPAVITRGAISAQGFGFAAGGVCALDGTKGIFAVGGFSTIRNKYTYATCTSTASGVAASSIGSFAGSAAGNSTRGIFAIGMVCTPYGGCTVLTREKYTYATCASSCAASASTGGYNGAAAANSTVGIFAVGSNVKQAGSPGYPCGCYLDFAIRNKYTFATDTSTGAASASSASYGQSAAGNSTRAIFSLGRAASGCYKTRDKFIYASCTNTSCGVAKASGCNQTASGAAGNSTRGIFALGTSSTTRNKYIYACCTSTASGVGAASTANNSGNAAGNSTRGIFALGNASSPSTTRNKYTYSTCASTACGVAAASYCTSKGASSSWATGVNT
jgi:hypothetical protein